MDKRELELVINWFIFFSSNHDALKLPVMSRTLLNEATALWSPTPYNNVGFCANVMLTSYLFPKEVKGKEGFVDELLKQVFKKDYDIKDWESLYKLHHTNIDKTKFLRQINQNLERVSPKYTR